MHCHQGPPGSSSQALPKAGKSDASCDAACCRCPVSVGEPQPDDVIGSPTSKPCLVLIVPFFLLFFPVNRPSDLPSPGPGQALGIILSIIISKISARSFSQFGAYCLLPVPLIREVLPVCIHISFHLLFLLGQLSDPNKLLLFSPLLCH